jgi:hypothetical protein
MTEKLRNLIPDSHTYHFMYVALHRMHKEAPKTWTLQKCNDGLSAYMACEFFSWQVVGITEAALKEFAKSDFQKNNDGPKITRAHVISRLDTAHKVFSPEEPLSEDEFWNIWLQCNKTILCAEGENKKIVPEYIRIDNPDCGLFPSNKKVGWRHGPLEQDCLRATAEGRN